MTPKEALDRHVHPDLTQKWAQPVLEAVLAAFDTYHEEKIKYLGNSSSLIRILCREEGTPNEEDWLTSKEKEGYELITCTTRNRPSGKYINYYFRRYNDTDSNSHT